MPARSGVGQILGAERRNLVIGRAANLRRWAASHLGSGKPARRGGRPKTDLRPVAVAVAWQETTSAFQQRLVFERLMARYVAPAERRDLRPPAFLRLDPRERFPRVTLESAGSPDPHLFGPFRDRKRAERASRALHKLFPLRPCDFTFEPDPALPLGLGCVFAQVRSCSAPCLARVSEAGYRSLAAEAARYLAHPEARPAEADAVPPWVAAAGAPALVVERGKVGLELYPIAGGAVLEEASITTAYETLEAALSLLTWPDAADRDDRAWLAAWLHGKRKGVYLAGQDATDAARWAARVRRVLGLAGNGNVGAPA